ncbi:MAG: M23 family metallopeptidase [Ardenticatenaceae bacterium]|nr:M23 family metallopeptidase [Ardenticatenaceae bacterium]MCB9442888.1 M23 family metallopeptidase [Ardenticatenaceae bacterium]
MRRQWRQWLAGRQTAVFLLAGLFLFAGCRSAEDVESTAVSQNSRDALVITNTAVPTATATPQPANTPTQTPSPTPTFTPTATAVPIKVTGDPQAAILAPPDPQENALCGIVDTLDFPLDPPDALNVSYGGRGFAQFRSRYDQYHAGEDWQLVRGGRSNFGKPVYAIGHGRVTYADPNGWGRDKGVIIVRHTFSDGSTVLSFYGHLDPPSVTLRAGDCVLRGQKIGEIGEPRTPPHLHFEIRTHMPEEPGPGYWPTDPAEQGWLPPSQFIWQKRMAAEKGVVWTRPFITEGTQNIGLIDENTFVIKEANELIGLGVSDGQLRWQQMLTDTVTMAMFDAARPLLYTGDRLGVLSAYPLLESEDGTTSIAEEPLWQTDLGMVGSPLLLPLPGGGVVVSVRQALTAVAPSGAILWQAEIAQRPFDWLLTADGLILTVSGRDGPIYSLTDSGLQEWPVAMNGRPLSVGDQIWLYADDGLHRLDATAMTAERLYLLPHSFMGLGSAVALPNGGALIAHQERGDRRLIAFNADGTVQWERSYAQLGTGESRLLLHNGQPYLLLQTGSDITTQFFLYAIDQQNSLLTHIFTGGTREPFTEDNWVVSLNDDLLLINIGGGSMAALDVDMAYQPID